MRSERANLTIEATFILTLYIFFLFTIFSLVRLLALHLVIQNAINKACLDISQYTYLAEIILDMDFIDDFEIDLGSNEIVEIFKDNIIEESEQNIYSNIIVKNMVERHLPDNQDEYLKNMGIKDGLYGIDFSKSRIDSKSSSISITYDISLPISIVDRKFTISQNARVNNFGRLAVLDKEGNEILEDSIWKKAPTVRGKIFINRYREKYSEKALKKGQVVDFYDIYSNELIQVNSINIYSKTYTDKNEDHYSFKYENVYRLVKRYAGQLLEKSHLDELEMMDGRFVQVNNPRKKLVLILPEEAVEFNDDLMKLSREIKNELDVNIEYLFEEKAL